MLSILRRLALMVFLPVVLVRPWFGVEGGDVCGWASVVASGVVVGPSLVGSVIGSSSSSFMAAISMVLVTTKSLEVGSSSIRYFSVSTVGHLTSG